MRLIMNAGQQHIVFGKLVRPGDEFEVPDQEAHTWLAMGWARLAQPTRPSKRYSRADMRAAEDD
jgi:hypothetical protein